MPTLVLFLLIFLAAGATLLAANLVLGRLVRPDRPSAAKGEAYECGERPEGPAWVRFDLRFYVVALLFVIFDVELAFFFPWAVVFGTANRAADAGGPDAAAMRELAWLAFADLMVFLGVLLVGFAYLWRRGDLDWVRSTLGQAEQRPGTAVPGNAER